MTAANVAAAFALSFSLDVIWVFSVRASVEARALHAAGWSVVMSLLGFAAVYLLVVTSWWLAIPATLGHGLGAYVAVRRSPQ